MTDTALEPTGEDALDGDSKSVLANRADHYYSDEIDLGTTPVVIRGTNKVFFQAHALQVEDSPSRQKLDALLTQCRGLDSTFAMRRIKSIAQLDVFAIHPNFIVLKERETEEDTLFIVQVPQKEDVLSFKRFSSLLAIPYAFSKKNPSFLNRINFDFYLQKARSAGNKQPIDILYGSTPVDLVIEKEGAEQTIQGYLVHNFLKVVNRNGKPASEEEALERNPPVSTRVPMFSNIIENIIAEVEGTGLETAVGLQSYALGYDSNRGRHFARLLFDGTQFKIKDDLYQLGLNIDTDFIGDSRDFGEVNVGFVLFRQICSNGLTAVWTAEDKAEVRKLYLSEQLQAKGFVADPDGSIYAEDENYKAAVRELEAQFHAMFSDNGLVIPVAQANAGFNNSAFAMGLKFFFQSRHFLAQRFESLMQEFGELDHEEFIKTILSLQKSMGMKSPELIKYFIMEYVAGTLEGQEQVIKTPFDVINLLTLLARAYDTHVMKDTEEKAMAFAIALQQAMIEKGKKDQALYAHYRGRLQSTLLDGPSAD